MKKELEINKLKNMLEVNNIPFEERASFDGTQLVLLDDNGKKLADAIQHQFSYGNEDNLIEIQGGLTEEELDNDSVLGYLTAEEVFKRFLYCYEHSSSIYRN